MLRLDNDHSESTKAHIAEQISDILRRDGYVRRVAAQAIGGEEGWRDLVAPVWLRVCASKVDFCALDEEERGRFLKRQARWALKDVLRPSAAQRTCGEDTDSAEIADPVAAGDTLWAGMEDRRRLEAIVREAWQTMPAFSRAILALYAGRHCEHDATVVLAERVGLSIVELTARTRKAIALEGGKDDVVSGSRGGRRGRQAALAGALGVTPGCLHQWNCRARNQFRTQLQATCRNEGSMADALPSILERVLA